MKRTQLFYLILLSILTHLSTLNAEGFLAGTLVTTDKGLIPIEYLTLQDKVFAYGDNGHFSLNSITNISTTPVTHYIKIHLKGTSIATHSDQQFYLPTEDIWTWAHCLEPGDILQGNDTAHLSIDSIETIQQDAVMYVLTVDKVHTFCVSPLHVVAHNFMPFIAIGLSFAFGAGTIEFVGISFSAAITILGMALGLIVSQNTSHEFKALPSHHGSTTIECFPPVPATPPAHSIPSIPPKTNISSFDALLPTRTQQAGGCGHIYITNTQEADPQSLPAPHIHIIAYPTQSPTAYQAHSQKVKSQKKTQKLQKNPKVQKERCPAKKVHSWKQFCNECPVGQKYKKHFKPTGKQNKGAPIYKVLQDVPEAEMLKKGNLTALDTLHYDHLEVWDKSGKWIGVSNLDGTKKPATE